MRGRDRNLELEFLHVDGGGIGGESCFELIEAVVIEDADDVHHEAASAENLVIISHSRPAKRERRCVAFERDRLAGSDCELDRRGGGEKTFVGGDEFFEES